MKWSRRLKSWPRKESSVHTLCPFLVSSQRRHWWPLGIGRLVWTPDRFMPWALWGRCGTTEHGFSLASRRAFHSFTQAHQRVSKVQWETCSLEQRTRAPSIFTLFWRIPDEPPRWTVVAEWLDADFLTSGGDKFNPGPETRLDCSELLSNKVLLKYKGDRESF